ncbi:hypothetical protein EJB05_50967 [Eragrostis curvula]|uniref:Uncharacterized protein n=1 Tax=Eragrostis curvula TaxID=38414 RepID=A0A5J9SWX0_9POAL|nr:hypothetical protein EJB05_50967 [Eragrostis curvula]
MAAASGRGGGGRSRAAPAWETQGGVRICIGEAAREAPDGGRGAAACGAELLQRGRCRAAGGAAQVRPRWRRKAAARSAAFSAAVLLLFTRQRDLAAAAFLDNVMINLQMKNNRVNWETVWDEFFSYTKDLGSASIVPRYTAVAVEAVATGWKQKKIAFLFLSSIASPILPFTWTQHSPT